MAFPNPSMDAVPFTPLTAAFLDQMIANIEALAAGTGQNTNSIQAGKLTNPYKFSVYRSASVTKTTATQKVPFNTELFDTNNNFDSTTNFRYTVPVSGFYQINAQVTIGSAGMGATEWGETQLYKNGASLVVSTRENGSGDANKIPRPAISTILQLSASDTLEVYSVSGGVYRDIVGGSGQTYFSGFLVSSI